jgi:hypothetical protein
LNFDQPRPTRSGISLKETMQAQSILSSETMAALGILPGTEVHPTRDSDQLGIELTGPEHDAVDASDFVEVHHD